MIYIVSGKPRTGTSMMMNALTAGGMRAVYDKNREQVNKWYSDDLYKLNECQLMEINFRDYVKSDFPNYEDNSLVKIFDFGLCFLKPGSYKIILMTRNPVEIKESQAAAFRKNNIRFDVDDYKPQARKYLRLMSNRIDQPEVTVLNYEHVLKNPLETFKRLKSKGWPIEPQRCIEIIKPECRRFDIRRIESSGVRKPQTLLST